MKNADGEYEKVLDDKGLGSGVSNRTIYNPLYDSQFKARNETNNINIAAQLNAEYMLLKTCVSPPTCHTPEAWPVRKHSILQA